jgi:hypothetical protein
VLEHLARCSECREVVVLALPAIEEVVLSRSVSPARTSWFTWPALRWGVVAAGILAVTSVGVLQYHQRHQDKTLVSTALMPRDQIADAPAQNQSSSPAIASEAVAPQAELRKQTATEKQTGQRRPVPRNLATAVNRNSIPAATTPAGPSPAPLQTSAQNQSAQNQSAQNEVQDRLIQNQQTESSQSSADFVYKAKSPPAQAFPRSMALVLPRWTISASGTLQRSLDEGLGRCGRRRERFRDRREKRCDDYREVHPSECCSQPAHCLPRRLRVG